MLSHLTPHMSNYCNEQQSQNDSQDINSVMEFSSTQYHEGKTCGLSIRVILKYVQSKEIKDG